MTTLYDDYHCLLCSKTEKKIHTLEDQIDKLVFPGEKLELNEDMPIKITCDYCGKASEAFIKTLDKKFVGIFNQSEFNSTIFEQAPETKKVFETWKNDNIPFNFPNQDFKKQPFNKDKVITIQNTSFTINKIYRSEWVEKDLDIRLDMTRPDAYWYELSNNKNQIKWLKVENCKEDNTLLTDEGIIIVDHTEKIEDITDNPSKIKSIYKTDWYGGRHIEAFQYTNGVRIIVKNHRKQTEMDIFEDTFDEAMESLENNMELGIFNE